jgi:hypothetical protein
MRRRIFALKCSDMAHLPVLLLSSLLFAGTISGDYKLVKHNSVLSLYERWIPGAGGETVREIKAVFEVKATLPAVVALFRNQALGREWNINASDYRIAAGTDAQHWITYIKYDIPWPMDDQDCCLLYHYREPAAKGETAEVAFLSITDTRFPRLPKTTRITGTQGKWQMEPQAAGQLKITYTVTTDRSKTIPRWVSDPIIHDNLFRTMTKFKSLLENNHTYDR